MATPMALRAEAASTTVIDRAITRNGLIKGAAMASLAQYAITSVHHVYGALVYDSAQKLMTPLIFALPLAFTLASLHHYAAAMMAVGAILLLRHLPSRDVALYDGVD